MTFYECPKCGESRRDKLFCKRTQLVCSTCETKFTLDKRKHEMSSSWMTTTARSFGKIKDGAAAV